MVLAGAVVFAACGSDKSSGGSSSGGAATAPAPAGTAIFTDDFSNPGSGWDIADNTQFASNYAGGRYRVLVKPKDLLGISSTLYEGPRDRPDLKELGEVNVGVNVVGDPPNGGMVGLVCRTRGDPSDLDYYGATLSASGRWAIVRQQGERRSQMTSGSAPSDLKFGAKQVALRLECRGGQTDPIRLRLFANGRFLGEGVDPSPWSSGGAGFLVASVKKGGVAALLDDLVLSTPA